MTEKWKHIRPSEYDWDYFKDTNGRETSMVRTLITGDEYIWEASLRPNYVAESHWHPYDICLLYTSPSPRDRTRSRMPSSA